MNSKQNKDQGIAYKQLNVLFNCYNKLDDMLNKSHDRKYREYLHMGLYKYWHLL